MVQAMKIDENVSVGGQPSLDELKQLASEGFKTVVNMRKPGEEEQPMSPEEERQQVEQLGLRYEHFPVAKEDMTPQVVDEFRQQLPQWEKPVFVHCRSGKRSGALVMVDRAVQQGWTGDEALQRAEQMGFECDVPEIKEFVKSYVDSKRA